MRLRLLTRTRPFPTYDPRRKQGSPHPLALASPPPGHLLPANVASFLSAARNVFAISVDHLFRLVSLPFGGRRSLHSTLVFPLVSYFRLSCPRTRRWSGVRWKTYVSDRWKQGWPVNACYATYCRLVCTHVSPYRIDSHTHHHRMFWAPVFTQTFTLPTVVGDPDPRVNMTRQAARFRIRYRCRTGLFDERSKS